MAFKIGKKGRSTLYKITPLYKIEPKTYTTHLVVKPTGNLKNSISIKKPIQF